MFRSTVVAFAAVLSPLSSAVALADQVAAYNGAAGGVPNDSPCWTYISSGGLAPPVNDGGAAALGPTTNSGYHYWSQNLVEFSVDQGASITASVHVTSSSFYAGFPYQRAGYYLGLSDASGRWAYLGIAGDRVLLQTHDQNWSDPTAFTVAAGAFHTYRLAFAGSSVSVSIDGVQVLSGTAGTGGGGASAVFGDLSILANSQTKTASVVVEAFPVCTTGDLNCSGSVDGADLGMLLAEWGTNVCVADLNHDGAVDGADLGILLANWG